MAKKVNTGLYIGIGVGILAIGGLVFFLIKRKKQKAMMTFPTATTPSTHQVVALQEIKIFL